MNAAGDVTLTGDVLLGGTVFAPQWTVNPSGHMYTNNNLRIGPPIATSNALDVAGDVAITGTLTVTSRLTASRYIPSSSSPSTVNGDLFNAGGVLSAVIGGTTKVVWMSSRAVALTNIASASISVTKFQGTVTEAMVPSLAASKIQDAYIASMSSQSFPVTKITGAVDAAQVPDLSTTKVTSGTFGASQFESLSVSLLNAGTLLKARGGTGATTLTSDALLKATSAGLGACSVLQVSGSSVGVGRSPSFALDISGGMFVGAGWYIGSAPRLSYAKTTATTTGAQWVRIATNGPVNGTNSGGDRCHAKFTAIINTTLIGTNVTTSITFYAGCMFGSQPTIELVHGGSQMFGIDIRIRIIWGTTYAGAAVDMYVPAASTMAVYMHENLSTNGFILSASLTATVPSGFSTLEKSLSTSFSKRFDFGVVGSFATMMYDDPNLRQAYEPGNTFSGSYLFPSGTFHHSGDWLIGFTRHGSSVSGTWRLHSYGTSSATAHVALYQRIL